MKNIIVGTAQLNSSYGISNCSKKIFKDQIKFLEFCYTNSLKSFDTSPLYKSEKIIGDFIRINGLRDVNVHTKIPSLHELPNIKKFEIIERSIENSTKNLNLANIDIVYFHDENDINYVINNISKIKDIFNKFKIKKIGCSIYSYKIFEKINKINNISCIQIPLNIINNDFMHIKSSKTIIARSIFLQGLLINRLKKKKNKNINLFNKKIFDYAKKEKIDLYNLNLNFIFNQKKINNILVGFDNISQIKKFLIFKRHKINNSHIKYIKMISKNINESIIKDPRKW